VEIVERLADPGDRPPAPGRLRPVQEFVNTLDIEHGREVFGDPAGLRRYLAGLGHDPGPLDGAALARALVLREALRRLLLANNGFPIDPDALARLEDAARAARLTLRFDEDARARLVSQADGLDGALGTIVAAVYGAMEEGTWPRLKACRRDVCHWVFWDASRNRSGAWCHMTVCGNRTKTRAYRVRRKS
jgi:predicted RNA-binding Zn ribbon-like protein